jgi:hypothetical protein
MPNTIARIHGQISRKRSWDLRSPLFASIADSIIPEDDIEYADGEE